jgi:hypothetical protein
MAGDCKDVRAQLAAAGRAVGNRLLAEGYDAHDVTETMLAVALASWSGLRDREAAAQRLRTVADEIMAAPQPASGHEPEVAA